MIDIEYHIEDIFKISSAISLNIISVWVLQFVLLDRRGLGLFLPGIFVFYPDVKNIWVSNIVEYICLLQAFCFFQFIVLLILFFYLCIMYFILLPLYYVFYFLPLYS
jgi:hypothetical protein